MLMKRIKVLFVVSSLTGGGAEFVAKKNIELVSALEEFDVSVITTDSSISIENVKKFNAFDFSKEKSLLNKTLGSLYLAKNKTAIKECLEKIEPDIIHIHNYVMFTPSLLSEIRIFKKEHDCAIVMTHHTYNYICTNDSLYNYSKDIICDKCIGKYNGRIIKDCCSGNRVTSVAKYMQKKIFGKTYHNLVDIHVAPSEFMKNQLLRVDATSNVKVIYNPCIEKVLPIDANKNRKIVYFGRINREKNIVGFTKLFIESENNFEFVIIGNGNDEQELKKVIAESPHKNITFVNQFLDSQDLYDIIKDARYFVLPSVWYENSPVSIVEGVNMSITPIVNNIGGMKELIDMFEVGHSLDITNEESVIKLLNNINDSSNDEVFVKSRKELEKFTMNKYVNSICNIYLSLYKN